MSGNFVRVAALWFCLGASAGVAQVVDFKSWGVLAKGQSGIVIIIDGKVSSFDITTGDKKFSDSGKWYAGNFVRQYRVRPGKFELQFVELGATLGVTAYEGILTYVRVGPYTSDEGGHGVRLTKWTGPIPGDVAKSLAVASQQGIPDAYASPFFDTPAKLLLISTNPPWPAPPPPPKN